MKVNAETFYWELKTSVLGYQIMKNMKDPADEQNIR